MRRLLLLALLVAGCSSATNATIDGVHLGPAFSPGTSAPQFTDYAATLLDKTPHAPVTATELYRHDLPPGRIEIYSGGAAMIVVYRLADGSARAFDIVCGIGVQPEMCLPAGAPAP